MRRMTGWATKAFIFMILYSGLGLAAGRDDGFFLNPSLYYSSLDSITKGTWSNSETSETATMINTTFGYSLGGGLLLGAKYLQESHKTTAGSGSSGSSDTETQVTAAGLSVGFKSGGLAVLISPMVLQTPRKDMKASNSKVTLSGGDGTQVDLMYLIDVGGWSLGPQLTWSSFTYKDVKAPGVPGSESFFLSHADTSIQPYISVFLFF